MPKPCRIPGCSGMVHPKGIRLGPRRRNPSRTERPTGEMQTSTVTYRWSEYPKDGLCYYHHKVAQGLMSPGK